MLCSNYLEFIIIGIFIILAIVILKVIFGYSVKTIKHIAENKELDNLAKQYPSNIELCRQYLEKLKNENVKIEENKEIKTSLYVAITDKIFIGNIQNSYTRLQTIAHECLHSIQNRRILIFNFIFSNIYLIYFITICLLAVLKIMPYKMMLLVILLIFSMIYYVVRIYLENDAMIKARYLAKEYMEEKKISTKEEIEKLVEGFDKINEIGIKAINCKLFIDIMIKALIFTILCIIF